MVPSSTIARRVVVPKPGRWTGVILVILVIVWSSQVTTGQIALVTTLLTTIGALLKLLS